MKINLNKLYIVYKPTKQSEIVDVFSGRPTTIQGLRNQFLGGLQSKNIHGIYTTLKKAREATNTLWKKMKSSKPVSKGYALFSDGVLAKHKYIVTHPPKVIYATKKEAQKQVDIERRKTGRNPGIKIMKYDKSKRRG